MKQKLTLLFFLIYTISISDLRAQVPGLDPLTPGSVFDTIFDKDGNKYLISDLLVNYTPNPGGLGSRVSAAVTTSCNAGYFNLYFENGSLGTGASSVQVANQAVLCQVFSDISNFITSPLNNVGNTTKVNIWVRDPANVYAPNPVPPGLLGSATQFYTMPGGSTLSGIVDGEIYKTIISGVDSYSNIGSPLVSSNGGTTTPTGTFFHGMVDFNFTNPTWCTTMSTTPTPAQYDLYSVALHEVTHALGFASLINYNGNSLFGLNYPYYSRYDLFLKKGNIPLITNTGSCGLYNYQFNSALSTTVITPGCTVVPTPTASSTNSTNCSNALTYSGSVTVPIYTPKCYEAGSSLSHFEDMCYGPPYGNDLYFVMSNANGMGINYTKRFLKPEERNALCDLGYNVKTTFGSASVAQGTVNYGGSPCPGIQIVGINDGISNSGYYTNVIPVSTTSLITNIVNNDYNGATMECLQVVIGNGTITGTTTTSFSYTPLSPGLHLLRYIPVAANGNKGNITYIYIYGAGTCTASPCNIVSNGTFENASGGGNNAGVSYTLSCWENFYGTSDLFASTYTVTSGSYGGYQTGVNTLNSTPAATAFDGLASNTHFIGIWARNGGGTIYNGTEAFENSLSSPLVNGAVYKLGFWAVTNNFLDAENPPIISNTVSPTPVRVYSLFSIATATNSNLTNFSSLPTGSTLLGNTTFMVPAAVPGSMTWTYHTTTFTYTGTANANAIAIMIDYTQLPNLVAADVFIDNVSIMPINDAPVINTPSVICRGTALNNLAQYVSPPGGSFAGQGVTNTSGVYNFNAAQTMAAGTYSISYTYTSSGCSYTDYKYITIKPTFTITPPLTYLYSGSSATLTATGSTGTYSWNPGSLTGNSVVVTPSVTTIYTVTNAASGTCTANNTATVIISAACSQSATATIGTSSISTTTLTAGTYSLANQVIDVNGTVVINGNTTIIGYTFRMNPGAKVFVTGKTTLTLDNCRLFGCTQLWDGIELATTTQNYQPNLNVINGTTIEDMYNGIYRNATYTVTAANQGFINITNSTLNKNYIGVKLQNLPPVTGGISYSLTVKNSTITSQQSATSPGFTLKPSTIPTYTYAYNQIAGGASGGTVSYTAFPRTHIGINLNNLSTTNPVVIGDSAGATNTYNTFSNLDFGIVATNAQLRVHNNYFYNLKGSTKFYVMGDIENPNPTPIGPDEIGIAVVAQHTVANTYSLQVGTSNISSPTMFVVNRKANVFKTINKGISAKNCNVVIAKGNWFEADTTNVPGSDYSIPGSSNTYEYYKAQSAVWITGLTKGSTLNNNYIRNYRVGLNVSQTMSVTTGAYVTIKSNNIQSLSNVGYCKQAINLEQVGGANIATDLLDVSSNSINNVFNGIAAKTIAGGLKISNNANLTLDNVKTYGKPFLTNYTHIGINLLNVTNAKVLTNTNINGLATITASNYSLTNAVYVTTSTNNTITCNTVNNVGRGFYFQGNCTSPNGWLGNGISNSYRGLELKSNGVIGTQGAASSTLAANTWSNVTQETFVSGTMNANTASNMFVSPNSGSPKTSPTLNYSVAPSPNYLTAFGQGIDEQTTGTPFSCGGGGTLMAMAASATSSGTTTSTTNDALYSNLATSSNTVYPTYPDEMTYQSQQLVYKLQKQGLVTKNATNPTLQSFYNANINSNIGKFTDVQDAVASNNKTLAQSKNNSINPTNVVQQKTKRANELMLKLNMNCNYQYSSTELQDLISMANECEVKGWYVAQSRSILNTISGTLLNYADNCEDTKANARMANEEEKSTSTIEPKRSFNVYPNPNNGSMTLTYDLGKDTEGNMNLYDVTGKLINTYNLSNTIGTIEINEAQLHNGIYFYCILVNGNTVNTNKIVIIK